MDDKFIYYLVLGAIYLVSRMLKKKKKPAPVVPRDQMDNEQEFEEPRYQETVPSKPSSFEDLLKEISQEFQERKEPVIEKKIVEPVISFEETTPKPKELTREQKYVKRKHKEASELATRNKLIQEKEEESRHPSHPVLELLHEEGGAANAVVLAEILNRRF